LNLDALAKDEDACSDVSGYTSVKSDAKSEASDYQEVMGEINKD
jgi:hypothetical protein